MSFFLVPPFPVVLLTGAGELSNLECGCKDRRLCPEHTFSTAFVELRIPQEGRTTLFHAAEMGKEAVAEVLLDAGVDKEAKDEVWARG